MTTPATHLLPLFGLAALVACDATDPVPPAAPRELYINEIMASNASFLDDAGAAADWVEIYNAGTEAVDLAGMYLCDDSFAAGLAACHRLPAGAPSVAPGGFAVFWFDGAPELGPTHVAHKLGGGGDAVTLASADGVVIDHIAYGDGEGLGESDASWGRVPDGGDTWVRFDGATGPPTPGAPNGVAAAGPSAPTVQIVTLDPAAPTFADVVAVVAEVAEVDDADGDLAGVTLSYTLDGGAVTEVAMTASDAGWGAEIGPFSSGGALSYTVTAVDAGGREGQSVPTSRVVAAPSGPRPLINELMAVNASFPDDTGAYPDWVEIFNAGDQTADLAGMYLADDHYDQHEDRWYPIPASAGAATQLAPGHFAVFWFDKVEGLGPRHVSEKLSGQGDAVYLVDRDGETVLDSLSWDESAGIDVEDVSLGRVPDGGETWARFGPSEARPASPGASNGD